jgi:hypothetical protein
VIGTVRTAWHVGFIIIIMLPNQAMACWLGTLGYCCIVQDAAVVAVTA